MNRTKKIYFLAAFVMIIGCYALNKSYSLFVATEEQEAVTSKVPILESSISMPTITLSSNEECLIKQTINNTSEVPINYSLSSTGTNYEIKVVDDSTNTALGLVEASTTKDIYLYLKNTSTEENTITFNLNKKYTTLNNDLTSNITDTYTVKSYANPYAYNTELLSYNIINNYITSDLYTGTIPEDKTLSINEVKNLFSENTKVALPVGNTGAITLPEVATFNNETEEKGLFQDSDDYGITYFYRGASTNNYVNFAGFLWRIVRINGDGSIRIIKDEIYTDLVVYNYQSSASIYGNIGYMYSEGGSATNYDSHHKNVKDSNIKKNIDSWYKTNIEDKGYGKYLSDSIFCADKTLASYDIGSGYSGHQNSTYSSTERLNNKKPTFKCGNNENEINNNASIYSRYTVEIQNLPNEKQTNGDLTYPIGLLTADEAMFAGTILPSMNAQNNLFYLHKQTEWSQGWATMSPAIFDTVSGAEIYSISSSGIIEMHAANLSSGFGVRPVINLKPSTLVSGNGTESDPYLVK